MVKIRVEALRDVPVSIVVGESEDEHSESWTVPVVIVQQEILGGGPPDVDAIPVDGNPHPQPLNQNFHPNQLNHFLGPVQQHQADDLIQQNQGNFHQQAMQEEEVDEMDDEQMLGWDHWAMPDGNELIDHEIEEGEFLELADILQPLEEQPPDLEPPVMDNNSEITVTVGSNANLEGQFEVDNLQLLEGNGNLNPMGQAQNIFQGLPDLNLVLGTIQAHQPAIHEDQPAPIQVQGHQLAALEGQPAAVQVNQPILQQHEMIGDYHLGLDLNLAPPVTIDQQVSNSYAAIVVPVPDEETGDFFALNLVEGMDPIIQLANPAEHPETPEKDDNYSISVDEEIEILDPDTEAISKLFDDTASMALPQSSDSISFPPPGFEVKGKFLTHTLQSGPSNASQFHAEIGHESLLAWKNHFATRTGENEAIKVSAPGKNIQSCSTPQNSGPGEDATVEKIPSPISLHLQGKRKDRAHLVESEVDPKICTEENLLKKKSKKGGKQPAWRD